MDIKSREYHAYQILQHWKATKEILPANSFLEEGNQAYPLFFFLYQQTQQLYGLLPKRKNGEESFIHPINVALALKEAGINDPITLCAGLVHDYVEESVDKYKDEEHLSEEGTDILKLEEYEQTVIRLFAEKLKLCCEQNNIPTRHGEEIIAVTRLLTRQKRDFYYQSICNIFIHPDENIKEKAIQVKLADRMHNILSIENFSEQERIYACFKNLFILNNTKKYLAEMRGKALFGEDLTPTERLFKRSAKATYDAFLRLCEMTVTKNISDVRSMLHLAFRKFAWENNGVLAVTDLAKDEVHLMRLYHQVVRKYDARLRHRWQEFKQIREDEFDYCKRFFADFSFSDDQIQAILDYKDAYSLKEVIAMLLYVREFVVGRFDYSNLFCER